MKCHFTHLRQRGQRFENDLIEPERTDYLYRFLTFSSKLNPLMTTVFYFAISFCGTILIGLLTGQFFGKNGLPPMYFSRLDMINLGFLAPVGAGLLCNLYNMIKKTTHSIYAEELVSKSDMDSFLALAHKADSLYNNRILILLAGVISILINGFNYLNKTDTWLGINGGITGAYARIFIFFNFFMIILILYKCAVTVWFLQKSLQLEVVIQPMHPDKCAGLKPFGNLAVALNSFLILIVLFFSLLWLFDPFTKGHPVYIFIFIIFYISIPFFLLLSLSRANKRMRVEKESTLQRLALTFDYYYKKLSNGPNNTIYDVSNADDVVRIHSLYKIVEKMPVWPFDVKTISRLIATITLPFIAFFFQLLTNMDSFLKGLQKIKGLLF